MKIPLSRATPGMKLKEDVVRSGSILLGANATLTTDLINILNKHGIEEVEVDQKNTITDTAHATPQITAVIAAQGMRADIHVKPSGQNCQRLTMKDLLSALEHKGISFGINEDKLQMLIKEWNNCPSECTVHGIATGSPVPQNARGIEFIASYIDRKDHFKKVQFCKAAWELAKTGVAFDGVSPGQMIAQTGNKSMDSYGMSVTGEKILGETENEPKICIDEKSVHFDKENRCWKSLLEGVVYYIDNCLGVLPLSFDGDAQLSISPDRMQASIVIHPAFEKGKFPDEKYIRNLFTSHGIQFGVKEKQLSALFECLARGECPPDPVVVAEGKPAENGRNGSITFMFDTETSLKPRVNPDGTVDYKNVNLIRNVRAGDELARLNPPLEGIPGCDIFGTPLGAKDGVPAKMPAGINTKVSEENESILVATVDGNVRYTGSIIEVSEGYVVKEDVDFGTGNVNYAKSVVVGGDIKSGFSVQCGGDLQVGGTIEDAHIKVGGNVLCKYGFVGQGKGVIDAHGDVNLSFLKNQTVRSHGSIIIAREAINGHLFARRFITVGGNHLSVAGGILMARDSINLKSVGNATGIKTLLEVGTDFSLVEEFKKTEDRIVEAEEILGKLKKSIEQYRKNASSASQAAVLKKLKATEISHQKEISSLMKRQELIRRKLYNPEAYVRIEHSALPGTIIKIGERQHFVREEVIGPKTARIIRHEVKIV